MAYVSAQWNCIVPGQAGAPSIWLGYGTDVNSSVGGVAGFITDAGQKGMRVNDVVIYVRTTAPIGATLHVVSSVNASTGAGTVDAAILA